MIQAEDLELFEHMKKIHPEWTENQNWVNVGMMRQAEEVVEKGGVDIEHLSQTVIELIVRRAQRWIGENLPELLEKVSHYFAHVLEHVGDWVSHGLNWLMETLSNIFSSIDF